jgi:hypothetical protein
MRRCMCGILGGRCYLVGVYWCYEVRYVNVMDSVVGRECDSEVGIAKKVSFSNHGVIISKCDPCFGGGGGGGGCS